MSASIRYAVVTPEREVAAGETDMVVIPAVEGEMGVMAGHQPTVATIEAGVVRLSGGDAFFVDSGFAEATPGRVQILVERAEDLAEVDKSTLADEKRTAEEDLREAEDAPARAAAERALRRARIIEAAL